MIYELKHFNTPILKFSADEESSEPNVEIKWVTKNTSLLPLDLELN